MDLRQSDLRAVSYHFVVTRFLVAALLLAGCMQQQSDPGPGWNPGGTPGGPGCQSDADCGSGYLCARTGQCATASEVRTIHVDWTVMGQTANATSCSSSPNLEFDFPANDGSWWGWAPVPCMEGVFTIDKMPTWFDQVQISIENQNSAVIYGRFDANNTATVDLPW